jgi:hypothetical protein
MIQLPKFTQFACFDIWQPRYSTDDVLLKCTKVKTHNKIIFTKAKHLEGKVFYVAGEEVKRCSKSYNGSITCYAVGMDKLQELELIENGELLWR